MVDNDHQGNLTAAVGLTPAGQKYTLANLLLAAIDYPEDLELPLSRCVLHIQDGLDLIPANKRLADAAARLQVMQLSQYSALEEAGRPISWPARAFPMCWIWSALYRPTLTRS